MKRIFTLFLLCVGVTILYAQSIPKADNHTNSQTVVIKIEGNQNGWVKSDNDSQSTNANSTINTENVRFYGTTEGIYVTINGGNNKIKLFALTGQLLYNGDLTQGRFLIQTRTGIYFLRINNKNFKVICK